MLSRQVVADVEQRYCDRVSIIASAMAGPARQPTEPSSRSSATSSLYRGVRVEPVNRLKVETGIGALAYRQGRAATDRHRPVRARDTVHALNDVTRATPTTNRREVNNLFGEGTSPKMRLIRTGLEALGLDANSFLRHNSRRIIYGVPLCTNTDEVVLRMSTRPRYLLPPGEEGTAVLVDYWRDRWLSSRVTRPDVLESVRGEEFEGFRLSRETDRLTSGSGGGGGSRRAGRVGTGIESGADIGVTGQSGEQGDHTFIERLYRSTNSYADRLTPDELESIHVDLGVDNYLVEQAEAGRQDRRDREPWRRQDPSDRAAAAEAGGARRSGHHRCQRLYR